MDLKKKLVSLDAQNEKLLEQLEYEAVLGERTRLAREIHDGLAQTLAFLKMEAARMQTYISKGDVDSVTRTLQACHQTLSDAYLDARQAIDNLRRVPDEVLGDWLQMTAADFKTLTDMTVDVTNVNLIHVFEPSVKAQLIRIVQEALTNIRKHAQSCTVTISAFERDGEAILEVRDNGCGFRRKKRNQHRNMVCAACASARNPSTLIFRLSARRELERRSACESRSGKRPTHE